MINQLPLLTQKRLILEMLDTHTQNLGKKPGEQIFWHITELGWVTYSTHWSKDVRDATHMHPYCPEYLKELSRWEKILNRFRAALLS